MSRRALISLVAALSLSASLPVHAAAAARLDFSPPEWKLGMILQGTVAHLDLVVTSREPAPIAVTLLPTCDCNTVSPSSQRIEPGGRAVFHLGYDSTYDRGITTKSFLVRTDLPGDPARYYWIRGTVREQKGAAAAPSGSWTRQDTGGPAAAAVANAAAANAAVANAAASPIVVSHHYSPGCRSCDEFLSVEIPRLGQRPGRLIQLVPCFNLPLPVVSAASWLGVTSGRITTALQAHVGKLKRDLAVVHLGLAVLTLAT